VALRAIGNYRLPFVQSAEPAAYAHKPLRIHRISSLPVFLDLEEKGQVSRDNHEDRDATLLSGSIRPA
jgi:hypothetical protein